jgi:hypothetical protein
MDWMQPSKHRNTLSVRRARIISENPPKKAANLLDAVVGLMGMDHRKVEVNFAWSPELPIDKDPSRTITFEPAFVPVMQEASKLLKSQTAFTSCRYRRYRYCA